MTLRLCVKTTDKCNNSYFSLSGDDCKPTVFVCLFLFCFVLFFTS